MTHSHVQIIKEFKICVRKRPVLTIVIPIRNIYGSRIRNCLKSIQLQNLKFYDIIIADYGSSETNFNKLMEELKDIECTVYRCPTKAVWSLSIARNIGIRRAKGSIVMTLDADMILEPMVLGTLVNLYKDNKNYLVISTVRDLNKSVELNQIKLPKDYEMLRQESQYRHGVGGLMSAPRKWWHKVRGFDERMTGWGAEDDDLKKRAKSDGRTVINLQSLKHPKTMVFHQWHPKPWLVKSGQMSKKELDKRAKANLNLYRRAYLASVFRNNGDWGIWS